MEPKATQRKSADLTSVAANVSSARSHFRRETGRDVVPSHYLLQCLSAELAKSPKTRADALETMRAGLEQLVPGRVCVTVECDQEMTDAYRSFLKNHHKKLNDDELRRLLESNRAYLKVAFELLDTRFAQLLDDNRLLRAQNQQLLEANRAMALEQQAMKDAQQAMALEQQAMKEDQLLLGNHLERLCLDRCSDAAAVESEIIALKGSITSMHTYLGHVSNTHKDIQTMVLDAEQRTLRLEHTLDHLMSGAQT